MHDHSQVGRGLVNGDTDTRHFFRQLGLGTGDAVLHLHLGVVQVGAQGEGDGQRQLAVCGGLGRHVQHVLHTGNGLLQRRGNGFANDLGVGAREVGTHTTVGGTTSGYSLIGSWNSEIEPAISSTSDSTAAKIGRVMKNFEKFIGRFP